MKNLISLLLALLLAYSSFAQKTETHLALNSGSFSFRGVSATETSQINLLSDKSGYINNPFGAKNGLCIGLSYQVQHVTKGGFVTGVSVGYEILRSKLAINAVNTYFDGKSTVQIDATGISSLSNHFINGFPYAGYRVAINPITLDITAGIDVGYLLKSHESGEATGSNGNRYSSFLDWGVARFDVRPRLQLSANYARVGVYAGYAHGLTNYKKGWVGGQNQCNSEVIRFGVLYKLRG